jgi:hypothetical protein
VLQKIVNWIFNVPVSANDVAPPVKNAKPVGQEVLWAGSGPAIAVRQSYSGPSTLLVGPPIVMNSHTYTGDVFKNSFSPVWNLQQRQIADAKYNLIQYNQPTNRYPNPYFKDILLPDPQYDFYQGPYMPYPGT